MYWGWNACEIHFTPATAPDFLGSLLRALIFPVIQDGGMHLHCVREEWNVWELPPGVVISVVFELGLGRFCRTQALSLTTEPVFVFKVICGFNFGTKKFNGRVVWYKSSLGYYVYSKLGVPY